MRPVRIAIRADASVTIGSGHVMRCAALGEALRERGAEVEFVCRSAPGDMSGWLEAAGFPVRRLAPAAPDAHWRADAAAAAAALGPGQRDWLIVDHYQLDARWELALRHGASHVLAIDDLADRVHACDVLLDQNLYLDSTARYDDKVPSACARLLGPEYALLRPQFREARARMRARGGETARILVAFGGSDPGNATAMALDAIAALRRPGLQVDVVAGAANPHRSELAAYCAGQPGMTLHCQVDDMAGLMLAADLCVGAGGSTTWERCCLGLPSLVVAVAANQVEAARTLDGLGYLRFLGEARVLNAGALAHALGAALSDRALLDGMARRGMQLVDGQGAARVAAVLMQEQRDE